MEWFCVTDGIGEGLEPIKIKERCKESRDEGKSEEIREGFYSLIVGVREAHWSGKMYESHLIS